MSGRPRDHELDDSILRCTVEILRRDGVDGVNFSRVAELAGTTRPALYRRFGGPTELAVAALHRLASTSHPERTGDGLRDLERELRAFRDAISTTNSIALVGNMLTPAVDPDLLTTYRELLVRPRRERIRAILADARADAELDATAGDLDVAVTMCTGSYYAHCLAGTTPPRDWPRRTARLVWRAAGGSVRPRGG